MPPGSYTVHVGTSSADTPLEATVDLNVMPPPLRLRLFPRTINLRRTRGLVAAELTVPARYSLLNLNITNVRFEAAPALITAFSSDGSTMVAIFDRSSLTHVAAGQNVVVSLAADTVKDGTPDKLWVTTTATVVK